jgi:hypothetical protein
MKAVNTVEHNKPLLASLLVQSGIVPKSLADAAQEVADKSQLPITQILFSTGHLGEGDIKAILKANEMLTNHQISFEAAIQTLRQSYKQCLPFDEVINQLSLPVKKKRIGQLARILYSARLISRKQLTAAMHKGTLQGQTLGQILVADKVISIRVLNTALELIALHRDGFIDQKKATDTLRNAINAPVRRADILLLQKNTKIKLGEILVSAGLLSEEDVLLAVEIALENGTQVGEVFLTKLGILPAVVDAALKLQKSINQGDLNEVQAEELLRQVTKRNVSLDQIQHELDQAKEDVVALLLAADVINQEEILRAMTISPMHSKDKARALLKSGILDLPTFRKAFHLVSETKAGLLSVEKAISLLRPQETVNSVILLDSDTGSSNSTIVPDSSITIQ